MADIMTPVFVASYPKLFTAQNDEYTNNEDQWSVTALFPLGTDLSALEAAIESEKVKKWGPDKKKWPEKVKLSNPIKNQGKMRETDDGKEVMEAGHVAGGKMMVLKTKKGAPLVYTPQKTACKENDFYAGCKAMAFISVYAYNHKGINMGVTVTLHAIQKVAEGEPITGRINPEAMFSPIEDAGTNKPATALFD